MRIRLRRWALPCCVLLAVCKPLAAEPANEHPLTLEHAIARVLERSPMLRAAAYDSRAAAARIRQAAQTTPFRANVELENFGGSGDVSGTGALEATLSLTHVLELGAKPERRAELARQKALLLSNEQDSERLDLLAETVRRFLQVVSDQESLAIARDALELSQRTVEVVERRVAIGKAPAAEGSRAAMRLARAELELAAAERDLQTSRLSLATSWGDTVASFSSARAKLLSLPPVAPFATLQAHLERNPDLVRFATARRVGEARLRLVRARRQPDLELAPGVRYLNDLDEVALVFSASLPLGTRQRAAPSVDEADALLQGERLRWQERHLALYSTLYSLHQELLHSRATVETLRARIIPAAEGALQDYEQGYSVGRYSFLELVDAQRGLLDARREQIRTAADYHRMRVEIDRLTGGLEVTGATP
jgi:cobalt-zinc-cadmium efflux system outer membrane protein